MTQQVVAGNIIPFTATFYDEPEGVLVNPTGLSLSIYKGSTLYAGPFTIDSGVSNPTTGLFSFEYEVPSDATAGAYTAMWVGANNGITLNGVESFLVSEAATDFWVTAEEASNITGQTVTQSHVAQAQSIVHIETGVHIGGKSGLGNGDRYWMAQAVAWQAAWVKGQFDLTTRQSVTTVNQDGLSATFTGENAIYLAPLTQKAIRQLSWMRTRTVGPTVVNRNFWDRLAESDEGWKVEHL